MGSQVLIESEYLPHTQSIMGTFVHRLSDSHLLRSGDVKDV